jgi:hypothetical protein
MEHWRKIMFDVDKIKKQLASTEERIAGIVGSTTLKRMKDAFAKKEDKKADSGDRETELRQAEGQ